MTNPTTPKASTKAAEIDKVDTTYLETLLGYNARRAALAIIEVFLERMSVYKLRPVDFSTSCLITHNPGITSRQICAALGILPPNLVGLLNSLVKRGLIERRPHPTDGRAIGLYPTDRCIKLMQSAEATATELENEMGARLSAAERKTLTRLLQKIYL